MPTSETRVRVFTPPPTLMGVSAFPHNTCRPRFYPPVVSNTVSNIVSKSPYSDRGACNSAANPGTHQNVRGYAVLPGVGTSVMPVASEDLS